jgi:hypothetical protein
MGYDWGAAWEAKFPKIKLLCSALVFMLTPMATADATIAEGHKPVRWPKSRIEAASVGVAGGAVVMGNSLEAGATGLEVVGGVVEVAEVVGGVVDAVIGEAAVSGLAVAVPDAVTDIAVEDRGEELWGVGADAAIVCMVVDILVWPTISGRPPLLGMGMGMLKEPTPQRHTQLQASLKSIVPAPWTTCPGEPTASVADDVLVADSATVGLMAVATIEDSVSVAAAARILIEVVSDPTGEGKLIAVTTVEDPVSVEAAAKMLIEVVSDPAGEGKLIAVTTVGDSVPIAAIPGMLIKLVSNVTDEGTLIAATVGEDSVAIVTVGGILIAAVSTVTDVVGDSVAIVKAGGTLIAAVSAAAVVVGTVIAATITGKLVATVDSTGILVEILFDGVCMSKG